MAKRYKKSILKVGLHRSPDGIVEVTPRRLRHWAKTHKRLSDAGLKIPVHWDHSTEEEKTIPMSAKDWTPDKMRSARDTVGHMKDFKLSSDGKQAEITIDLHRKSAIESADNNTVFVSPIIRPEFRDGAGNVYSDVIATCDFVDHPVDHKQGPFEPAPAGTVACGIRMGLGDNPKKPKVAFRLKADDYDDYDDEDDEDTDDEYNFSDNNADESGTDMDTTSAGADTGGGTDTGMETETETETETEAETETKTDAGGDMDESDEELKTGVLADLEAAGIAPPEGVDPVTDAKDFLRQLCAALRQKKLDEQNVGTDMLDEDEDMLPLDESEVDVSTPDIAAMSAYRYTQNEWRKGLEKRIDELVRTGRATPAQAKKKKLSLNTVRLSVGASGRPKRTALEDWIEDRECLPAGAALEMDSVQRLSLGEVALPSIDTDMDNNDPESARKAVDEQVSRHPSMYQDNGKK